MSILLYTKNSTSFSPKSIKQKYLIATLHETSGQLKDIVSALFTPGQSTPRRSNVQASQKRAASIQSFIPKDSPLPNTEIDNSFLFARDIIIS